MIEERFSLTDEEKAYLTRNGESTFEQIEALHHVQIITRKHGLIIRGGDAGILERAQKFMRKVRDAIRKEIDITPFYIDQLFQSLNEKGEESHIEDSSPILRNRFGQAIQAKTPGQVEMVKAVRNNPIVFVEGPAGTGKTYLAVCLAIAALEERRVERISLVRPAVEAGENLGFLPGDLKEKIAPYLRPLYDAINELIPREKVQAYQENNAIEVAPLAYMRGRTLKKAFVILDEAQNTTIPQMKMFLTRIGPHSRVIITGDSSQTDLPNKLPSGFSHAMKTLEGIPGISHIKLSATEVLRHPLVSKIIQAYERVGL